MCIESHPGWLELPLVRTNFHDSKPVRATEVQVITKTNVNADVPPGDKSDRFMPVGNSKKSLKKIKNVGPVVQSIVSLTSSLRGQLVKCFTAL